MIELVQWLRAQLDAEDQVARAADPELSAVFTRIGSFDPEMAADERHIMTHQPARVLREIDADRVLLGEYSRLLDANAAHQREAARLAEVGDDADVIQLAALRREADYLPAMLHVLERWAKRKASVYADRPGYKESWRP